MDRVYEDSSNLGLKINIAKTEVRVIGKPERKPNKNQHQWNKFKASRELHLPRRDHIPKRELHRRYQK